MLMSIYKETFMGKPCVPAIESCSCISSAGLVRRLVWRFGFHQSQVKFVTPHELLAKNTWSLVQDSNKIGKHTRVIKNKCQVWVELYRTSLGPCQILQYDPQSNYIQQPRTKFSEFWANSWNSRICWKIIPYTVYKCVLYTVQSNYNFILPHVITISARDTRTELPCATTWFCVSYVHGHVQLTHCI